jgi:hypothetical protein
MYNGLYLTLMVGPGVPVPVPQSVLDALVSIEITERDTGTSVFQLTFNLSTQSPLHTLFLLAGGNPIPIMRVVVAVTLNGLPEILIDGVITHQQVSPGADAAHSILTITGEDLTHVMGWIDFSGIPYPAMPPEARVALILAKYAFLGIVPLVIPSVLIDVPIPVKEIPRQKVPTWLIFAPWLMMWGMFFIRAPVRCLA